MLRVQQDGVCRRETPRRRQDLPQDLLQMCRVQVSTSPPGIARPRGMFLTPRDLCPRSRKQGIYDFGQLRGARRQVLPQRMLHAELQGQGRRRITRGFPRTLESCSGRDLTIGPRLGFPFMPLSSCSSNTFIRETTTRASATSSTRRNGRPS